MAYLGRMVARKTVIPLANPVAAEEPASPVGSVQSATLPATQHAQPVTASAAELVSVP